MFLSKIIHELPDQKNIFSNKMQKPKPSAAPAVVTGVMPEPEDEPERTAIANGKKPTVNLQFANAREVFDTLHRSNTEIFRSKIDVKTPRTFWITPRAALKLNLLGIFPISRKNMWRSFVSPRGFN